MEIAVRRARAPLKSLDADKKGEATEYSPNGIVMRDKNSK